MQALYISDMGMLFFWYEQLVLQLGGKIKVKQAGAELCQAQAS